MLYFIVVLCFNYATEFGVFLQFLSVLNICIILVRCTIRGNFWLRQIKCVKTRAIVRCLIKKKKLDSTGLKNARHGWRQQCINRSIKDVVLYFLKTFYSR